MKSVDVGGYVLELPDFWGEGGVRQRPGFAGYNALVMPGVSFDMHVIAGAANKPAERAKLVGAFAEGHAPARRVPSELSFKGTAFEVNRLEGCKSLGGEGVYESYCCDTVLDLLHFGFAFTPPLPQEESLRTLFLTMVTGAIARWTPPA